MSQKVFITMNLADALCPTIDNFVSEATEGCGLNVPGARSTLADYDVYVVARPWDAGAIRETLAALEARIVEERTGAEGVIEVVQITREDMVRLRTTPRENDDKFRFLTPLLDDSQHLTGFYAVEELEVS